MKSGKDNGSQPRKWFVQVTFTLSKINGCISRMIRRQDDKKAFEILSKGSLGQYCEILH